MGGGAAPRLPSGGQVPARCRAVPVSLLVSACVHGRQGIPAVDGPGALKAARRMSTIW